MPIARIRLSTVANALTLLALGGVTQMSMAEPRVQSVARGASVVLELPRPHDSKLAVVTPTGEWLFLVDQRLKKSLMSERTFLETSKLRVDTETLSGVRFVDGSEVSVNVFTIYGQYTFVVADNLETEPENMRSISIVVEYAALPPNTSLERTRDK